MAKAPGIVSQVKINSYPRRNKSDTAVSSACKSR
jgi:hypothetical protein